MTEPPSPGGRGKGTVPPRGLVGTRSGTSRPHLGFQATTLRRRPGHRETRAMWGCRELLLLWVLVPAAGGTEHVYRPGRRVCALGAPQGPVSESFAQRVYQPFLTTCEGPRVCSTYRTIYRTAYRRSPGPTPARPRYACCPGWKRTGGLPAACGAAICQPPCQNGGSCVQPGRCHCPAGWRGDTCQTGVDGVVEEEVQRLRSRVDVLEQKLQLVLAPLHSLASRALEQGLPDPGSLLAHSLRQLDRIDSLSEQISFLEEQLGSCSCKKEL
ncbi:epidermal growth factor-like protein 7 isoform X5 [Phyllostomus hastatus]|uniref:epidermal growth factor-like protein 7 isoform X5 n=1 Tax=Phyllostomus hastatus TaxID=9423 RepID=UPI001E67F391|nr:epidermal growth factor-like protein 7 isoform X5 [Phyllostomus hastatus]